MKIFRAWSLGRIGAAMLAAALGGAPIFAAAPDRPDVMTMPGVEIAALQQRLADAGCYKGPLDGTPSAATRAAVSDCPDQRPQLRIETGMHVGTIRQMGTDAACRLAATASEDKTVRLWSLPDGKLLQTLRLPIGSGDGGKVNAAAISPDGRFVAVGGWDAADAISGTENPVTIFEAATGAIVTRVGLFEKRVARLVFSPDGRWLALTLNHGAGMRVIETATWREIAADKAYADYAAGAVFAPDGRLYTVAWDGKLRRYGQGPAFIKESEATTRGGKQPTSIDIDPAGQRLAVGFSNSIAVDIYDAPTLRFRMAADTFPIRNGDLSSVAWSHDDRTLMTGGTFSDVGRRNDPPSLNVLFDRDGRRPRKMPLSHSTITDLKACGSGFAAAAADPAFGLLAGDGRKVLWRESAASDMRGKAGDAFTLSADAKRLRFGLGYGSQRPVVFDVSRATLTDSRGPITDLAPSRTRGLSITGWRDSPKPLFDGRLLPLEDYEVSRSLAIRPRNDGFVLGTEFYLRAFDAAGRQLWRMAVPETAWGLTLSGDGRLAVAAYGDGTMRWHRWSDGKELLALFVDAKTKAWVAWTPSGYYSASPGGEDMIGWHVNRGWAQAADFFPADKFRDTFSRPDIVERMLDTLDEDEAVRQADAVRPGKRAPAGPITDRLPPVLSILSPQDGASVGDSVTIDYIVRSPSGLTVDGIDAMIDGRPAPTARGLARVAPDVVRCLGDTRGLGHLDGALQGCRGSLTLSLPAGASTIGLVARAGDRASVVAGLKLARSAAPEAGDRLKPKLYALVVGVSAYANKDYALAYAAKDARDFADAMKHQEGGLYGVVDVRLLADGQASAVAIRDGLDWLTKQVTSRDVGLIYLAGHGMLDERDHFYYLAADSDAAKLRGTAIPKEDISDALDALAGKALLFLDACHSGAIAGGTRRGSMDINAVVNDFARAERGVVAFTASTGKQVSQENPAWGNGAFTKAVIEGLGLPGRKAGADYLGDGKITTSELDVYVTERVKALTAGAQSPVMIRPPTVPDFPLAVVR